MDYFIAREARYNSRAGRSNLSVTVKCGLRYSVIIEGNDAISRRNLVGRFRDRIFSKFSYEIVEINVICDNSI